MMTIWMIMLTFVMTTGEVKRLVVSNDPAPPFVTQAQCEKELPELNENLKTLWPDPRAHVEKVTASCKPVEIRRKDVPI